MVARDRLAADMLRGQRRTVTPLLQKNTEGTAGPRPGVAVLDHPLVEILQQLDGHGDPLLAELAGV